MGADLYITPIYRNNEAYAASYDEACRKRDEAAMNVRAYQAVVDAFVCSGSAGARRLPAAKRNLTAAKRNLTILQRREEKLYEKRFCGPGYFRDSYNGTSVLWRLGLLWWTDAPKKPTAKTLRKFRDKVVARRLKPVTAAELMAADCRVDNEKNSVAAWSRYFSNKKRRLVRFLDRAIKVADRGGEIRFSC